MFQELENRYLKKLKTILKYSIITISIIIIIIEIKIPSKSKYTGKEKLITGRIQACQTKEDKIIYHIKGKEKLIVYADKKKCTLGAVITAKGKITKPSKNTIFHLFNYRNYLLSKRINYIFYADKVIISKTKIPIKYQIKNKIEKYIENYKSSKYMKAFILGKTEDFEEEIKTSYIDNGIIHMISLSKSQLTVMILIITYFLNKIIKNRIIKNTILINFLIFYLFLTDYGASITRAFLTYYLMKIKKEVKIKIKKEEIIVILFLINLTINPYNIYNTGFKLTYIISFFIIKYIKKINHHKNSLSKAFAISLTAFIASIPIVVNNNFKINLLTPIYNILFMPLISLIIYPLSLLAIIIKPLDKLLNVIILLTEKLSLKVSEIKYATIVEPYFDPIEILIYYIIVIAVLNKIRKNNQNYIIIIIAIIIIRPKIYQLISTPKIISIDVGQGDSTLINYNQKNILIDTGGNLENKKIHQNIIDYMHSIGIYRLNYALMTHGDFDHMGEAINLVNNFKIEKVIFNCGPFNELEQELIKVLDKKKIKYYSCIKELNIDKNKLYFLQTKEYDNENDNSNVIYTELNGYKFMLMGDASITTEKEILNKYNLPDIDVLKVGHHGSKTSSSKEFINEINPRYSTISVGKNNRYGHPNKDVLNNLDDSKIYRTDQDGSIMFKIKNDKLRVETCSP